METKTSPFEGAYPEKVLSIYHAVIHFFCSERDLSTVKITDIAQAAGIGKGTVYEYFSSKEEVIVKAVLYAVEIVFDKISTMTRQEEGIKNRIYSVMEYLLENNYERIALIRALTQDPLSKELKMMLQNECDRIETLKDTWAVMARRLLEDAVKEGVILPPPSDFYWQMVLHGALSGLMCGQTSMLRMSTDQMSNREIMDSVYRMMIKALN